MRALAILAAVALCFGAARASDDPTISLAGVVDLTPENFDSIVDGSKHVIVEFYAPWCGHCKRMTPEYKKLGELAQSDPKLKGRVVIGKVNADAHRELGTRFEVKGFPTIKYFKRGVKPTKDSADKYEGGRTADAFAMFLKGKLDADKGFARVEALDALALKAGKAAKGDLKKVAAELEAAAAKLEGEAKANGALYVKLALKAADKGVEFFKTEAARLERMISSGSVAASKLDEMSRKASVLGAFVGDAAGAEDKEAEE